MSKGGVAGRGTISTGVIVPIVAAVLAATAAGWAGRLYDDLTAYFLPDKISGEYVVLSSSNTDDGLFDEDLLTLKSHNGVITGKGERGDKRWTYSGYLKNGYVVLAYHSVDPNGLGFGTYFLGDPTGNAREYVGYVEGNYCPERRVFHCNAVLVKGNIGSPEERGARSSHADILKSKCTLVSSFAETSPAACSK